MRYRNIAIEREYGSGGTQIGQEVSKRLGIACCSKEIYEKVADVLGIPVDEVETREESVTNSFLYSIAMLSNVQNGKDSTLSTEQKIHLVMQKQMQEIANRESCVFIGHCAMEALKDRNDVLRVFVRADDASKNQRIVEEYGIAKENAERRREKFDKRRRNAFRFYTTKKWEAADNYDLILDSGKLGVDNCVEILVKLLTREP